MTYSFNKIILITTKAILVCLPIIIISCNGPVIKKNVTSNDPDTKSDTNSPGVSSKKIDSIGKSLIIKINKDDSILIKGIYTTKAGSINPSYSEQIFYNGKQIYLDSNNSFKYDSKYNRVINKNLLFLESEGSPDFNHIVGFKISKDTAKLLVNSVYNDKKQGNRMPPFSDMDKDGYLEFGGFDLTEYYPSKDSMYYNSSQYYEIKNDNILFDSSLTKKMDMQENGIYLRDPINKQWNCCVVIKKPKKLK